MGVSFDKVVDQNFPSIFYFSPIFTPPIFHWANNTLNKTFSLDRKEAQNEAENFSQKLGEPQPKTGGVVLDYDSRFGGIKATACTLLKTLEGMTRV